MTNFDDEARRQARQRAESLRGLGFLSAAQDLAAYGDSDFELPAEVTLSEISVAENGQSAA